MASSFSCLTCHQRWQKNRWQKIDGIKSPPQAVRFNFSLALMAINPPPHHLHTCAHPQQGDPYYLVF
jgi:hypothetical protein